MIKHHKWACSTRHYVLLLLLTNFMGCGLSGLLNPSVHYILPDGYLGVFKIVRDEANGIDVKEKDGRYTYEIPPDGILRVKSFAPIEQWHEVTAAYRNGTKIVTLDSTVRDSAIALRDTGTHERDGGPRTITILIGTKEQADRVMKDKLEAEFDRTPPEIYNRRLIQR